MTRDLNLQKAKLERDFRNLKTRANEYYDRWYESTQRHSHDEEVESEKRSTSEVDQLSC